MNKKTLIERIIDNWPAKVICLVIAIFLYIFHQASLIEKRTFTVPLEIQEKGLVTHVGNAPKNVTLMVRASDEAMKSISVTDMHASVNIENITEKGVYELPVVVTLSEKLMAYDPLEVTLKEKTVSIEVDKNASKYVSVVPSIVGEVAHGYKITEVTVNPSVVLVTGTETILNAVDSIQTTKINVSNAEKNFSTEADYLETSSAYQVEDKGPYKATIVVEPLDHEQKFTDIPVEIINLSDNLEIINELSNVTLTLAGTMPDLEAYKVSQHLVQIDLKEITEPGEYEINLIYNVPKRFELLNKSDDFMKVRVMEKILEPPVTEESIVDEEIPAIENVTSQENGSEQ